MPKRTVLLHVPLGRQQGEIGQRLPGSKWNLAAAGLEPELLQEFANVAGFRPEFFVRRVNAKAVGGLFSFRVRSAGNRGNARYAATGQFDPNYRLWLRPLTH